jgi:clan AA aspartic protease (TIGR02281 family)
MRPLLMSFLAFLAGCGLGWVSHMYWVTDPMQSVRPVIPAMSTFENPADVTAVDAPSKPGGVEAVVTLLQRNDFEAALEQYEALQVQADELAVADARARILSYARRLIADHRFMTAEALLQHFLVAAYRDVDAHILLAAAFSGQQNFEAAIDQLYEARGVAYRPAMLERISKRIRSTVTELAWSLKSNEDYSALLMLYQRLIQLEPDHAPWFMGLAAAQLALEDVEAARRSLLLVAQDPDVGARAQTMLAELNLAADDRYGAVHGDTVSGVAAIPLHRQGSHFIVEAQSGPGQGLRLLIDTGASLTILTPGVLEQPGIRYQDTGRTGIFNTANGPVDAPVYTLESLAVGDWKVDQVEVGVLELGDSPNMDGLLGMNFLNHFQFFIDQHEATLRLSPD